MKALRTEICVQDDILLVRREGKIATLTLNRPEKRNSLSPRLVNKLRNALDDLAADAAIHVLIIRGAGEQAFCSGYDIRALPTEPDTGKAGKLAELAPVEETFQAVADFPFPVIAAINGYAFGAGCELALCCDIRIGAENIRMGMPPAKLGMVYPHKGLQRFISVLGIANTKELFFTGRAYPSKRLKEMGMLHYHVPAGELESFTNQLAADIAANAPLSLKGNKHILNLLANMNQLNPSDKAHADALTEAALNSEDLKEGQRAFLEKRRPQFKGK